MFLSVQVHPSASPEEQKKVLHRSLETRIIHPRLHYETPEQTRKWLKVHQRYSPIAQRTDTLDLYRKAGDVLAQTQKSASFQVISLGCGTGVKDRLILEKLEASRHSFHYFPSDISLNLVLEACAQSQHLSRLTDTTPIVCDLKKAKDLADFLRPVRFPEVSRVFLFFGILPNMEPQEALECLQALLRPNDYLLIGTNLAPHSDCHHGIQAVLPQYNNPETHEWLLSLLDNVGIPLDSGSLRFEIRDSPTQKNLKRIEAIYEFKDSVEVQVDHLIFRFNPGDSLCLFFSNRHTPHLLQELLILLHLSEIKAWTNSSKDEIVVLSRMGLG